MIRWLKRWTQDKTTSTIRERKTIQSIVKKYKVKCKWHPKVHMHNTGRETITWIRTSYPRIILPWLLNRLALLTPRRSCTLLRIQNLEIMKELGFIISPAVVPPLRKVTVVNLQMTNFRVKMRVLINFEVDKVFKSNLKMLHFITQQTVGKQINIPIIWLRFKVIISSIKTKWRRNKEVETKRENTKSIGDTTRITITILISILNKLTTSLWAMVAWGCTSSSSSRSRKKGLRQTFLSASVLWTATSDKHKKDRVSTFKICQVAVAITTKNTIHFHKAPPKEHKCNIIIHCSCLNWSSTKTK